MGEFTPNQAVIGLDTDSTEHQIAPGTLTFAMNAMVENFSGERVTYQNEPSNILCTTLPEGFRVVGLFNITQLERVLYFLVNPATGYSEVGFTQSGGCTYTKLFGSECIGFDVDFPIQQVVLKNTNCGLSVYWTDGNKSMRFFEFENLPWAEKPNANNPYKPTILEGQVDCNKLLVQPNFKVPQVNIISDEEGGTLTTGTYQFVTQYANEKGEGYTQFYNVTNPISINQPNRATEDFNLPTSKAIRVKVRGMDTTGVFDFFNLVVIETINALSTPKLVGTYPVTVEDQDILYTGGGTLIQLAPEQLFQKYLFYETADGVTQSDGRVIWYGLKENNRINYQDIWTTVKLQWVTHRIPYNSFEGYNKAMNTYEFRTYMRDEVYPFEGVFLLDNGQETDRCTIPGRVANQYDLEMVSNDDATAIKEDACEDGPQSKPRWQVYNTGTNLGFTEEYNNSKKDDCYKGPYEYGDFAYWESEEKYPSNSEIWGSLAGQPIRHHKFPDSLITHIHDNESYIDSPSYKSDEPAIFPIGIRLDINSLYSAIQSSSLSQEEKDRIVGFRIIRGDRTSSAYQSIVAKGLLNNVGYTEYDGIEHYYPNYPFNDLRPDPYFVKEKLAPQAMFRPDRSIDGFGDRSRSRFTFHSPDTHFYQKSGIDTGTLKIETIEYGRSEGHFVEVLENAEYKFLTQKVTQAALGLGQVSGLNIGTGTFGWPSYSVGNVLPAFAAAKELFEKLANFTNFGYSFNSVGRYNNYYPVPNGGIKQRPINFGKYIVDGKNSIENGNTLEATRRESSVYLHTEGDLLFPPDYNLGVIPQDTSRFNITSYSGLDYNEFWRLFVDSDTQVITDEQIRDFATMTSLDFDLSGVYLAQYNKLDESTEGLVYDDDLYTIDNTGYIMRIYGNYNWASTDPNSKPFVLFYFDFPSETPDLSVITYPAWANLVQKSDPDTNSATKFLMSSIDLVTDEKLAELGITLQTRMNITDKEYLVREELEKLKIEGIQYQQTLDNTEIGKLAVQIYYYAQTKYFAEKYPSDNPDKIRESKISSYYGSIKANLPAQWGTIHSFSTIDTGFYHPLKDDLGRTFRSVPTIFGGDTFINKFALKIKLPFFKYNTVGKPDGADIAYDEIGTISFPMFWISTKPEDKELNVSRYIDNIIKELPGGKPGGGFLNTLGNIVKNVFTGGLWGSIAVLSQMAKLITEVGIYAMQNINLDEASEDGIVKKGKMYLFAYGIPYFFVESQVNVDYRQATNDNEGNYYPRVGNGIPDDWLQEVNVPIVRDNSYVYNQTFSKQNRESFFDHLPENFDPNKLCQREFPNRAMWSEKTDLNETLNNWKIYKPLNIFDFPKSYGDLIALDGIVNGQILARFDNKSQMYNALTAINTNNPLTAYLGNPELFSSTPPIDLSDTDNGSMGTEHKFLLKTKHGVVFIDSKRGQVILLQGNSTNLLSEIKNSKWFSNNLPFQINKHFKDVDIDNNFKGIGITGVFDEYYNRLIITKKDYIVIDPTKVKYDGTNFRLVDNNSIVQLSNKTYFKDISWTMSFSFITNSWTSWHSYIPNYYVSYPTYFQSGFNYSGKIYDHNKVFSSFGVFQGVRYPYVLEYPFSYKMHDEIVQSIKDYSSALIYTDDEIFAQPDKILYFNKAMLYNRSQNSGVLNLIPKMTKSLRDTLIYPKYNTDSKDIIVTRTDNFYNFNTFWDTVKDKSQPMFLKADELIASNIRLNTSNIDYGVKSYTKAPLRAKDLKVRLILDGEDHTFKLISRFILSETQKSII